MSLGIPGDSVMALLLGALIIQGIQPGPQLVTEHPDIFWGLIASFWIGNILLLILNVPLIGIWVKMLRIPYRYLYPAAMLFICIGVYSADNDLFTVGETLVIGLAGYFLLQIGFHPAPILLGFVLGPRMEGEFPPGYADIERRPEGVHRASDQRRVPRALPAAHRASGGIPATQAEYPYTAAGHGLALTRRRRHTIPSLGGAFHAMDQV